MISFFVCVLDGIALWLDFYSLDFIADVGLQPRLKICCGSCVTNHETESICSLKAPRGQAQYWLNYTRPKVGE